MFKLKDKASTDFPTPDRFFLLLSDETRLRALVLLVQEGELCVCEFTGALKIIQPKISRHLAILRKENIVLDRRDGTWIYYRLNTHLPKHYLDILKLITQKIKTDKPYSLDNQSLQKIRNASNCCS